jgi:CheY-like chemotaxis protein
MPQSLPSILAVEDNPETQLLLQHLLRPDFQIVVTDGVDGALEASQRERFDILLLDINLSEQQTGIELLRLLRRGDGGPRIPAIALTAYAMPGDRESFIEAGFDAYVSKPFTRSDLTKAIESTLSSTEQ